MNVEKSKNSISLYNKAILFVGFIFVTMNVLDAPIRMILSQVGLSVLAYVPKLLMLVLIGIHLLREPKEIGFCEKRLISLLVVFYSVLVGLLFMPTKQVIIGFYVLVPFVFAIVCARVFIQHASRCRFIYLALWTCAVVGVFFNQFIEYPWEGLAYSVGDVEVSGSRQWYASGGKKRLAGFSRASFDAAAQIQILAILLVVQLRSFLMRLTVWCLTFAMIIPTNSKGILLVAVVLFPIVLFRRGIPGTLLRMVPISFGTLALALPVSVLLLEFHSQFNNPKLASATFSFFDRLNRMWPEAWTLLAEHGNTLMGRGLGGIGTAQSYYEISLFNAGDNVFMYFFVIFGLFGLPAFFYILLKTMWIRPHSCHREFTLYCLLIAVLVYGSMTNIVENAILAFTCGIVVRWICSSEQIEASAVTETPAKPARRSPAYG